MEKTDLATLLTYLINELIILSTYVIANSNIDRITNWNWVHELSIRNVCQTHRKSSNKCWVVWIVNSSEPGSLSVFKLSDILLTRSIFCHFSVTMWRTSFPIPHISVSIWKPLISELVFMCSVTRYQCCQLWLFHCNFQIMKNFKMK